MLYFKPTIWIIVTSLLLLLYSLLFIKLLQKWRIVRKEPSYGSSINFRLLWYIFLTSTSTHIFCHLFDIVKSIFPQNKIIRMIWYFFFNLWALLFLNIEFQIYILVDNVVRNANSLTGPKEDKWRKIQNLHFITFFLLTPIILYMHDFCAPFSETIAKVIKRSVGWVSPIITLLNGLIVGFLIKKCYAVNNIIKQDEQLRDRNKKNLNRWKIFLVAIMVHSFLFILMGIFFFLEMHDIPPFSGLPDKDKVDNGFLFIRGTKIMFMILKFYATLVVVVLSPYSYIKRSMVRN